MTENEVKRMKGKGGGLSDSLVHVQCTKPSDVVARTIDVLDKYRYNEAASLLKGW